MYQVNVSSILKYQKTRFIIWLCSILRLAMYLLLVPKTCEIFGPVQNSTNKEHEMCYYSDFGDNSKT